MEVEPHATSMVNVYGPCEIEPHAGQRQLEILRYVFGELKTLDMRLVASLVTRMSALPGTPYRM